MGRRAGEWQFVPSRNPRDWRCRLSLHRRLDNLELSAAMIGRAQPVKPERDNFDWNEFVEYLSAHVTAVARPSVDTPRHEIHAHVREYLEQWQKFYSFRDAPGAPQQLAEELEAETERIASLTRGEWWR